jgi:predicted SprT family Zn-dependent metalloprotease
MTQLEALSLARQLMTAHGLQHWTLGINRRKRALGLCRYDQRRIELSLYFLTSQDAAQVRDTILHEIAHALAGREAGHGPRWKAMCQKVGARPERCDKTAVVPAGRWRAECPSCGQTFTRHRRPMRGRKYMCRHCGLEKGTVIFRLAE